MSLKNTLTTLFPKPCCDIYQLRRQTPDNHRCSYQNLSFGALSLLLFLPCLVPKSRLVVFACCAPCCSRRRLEMKSWQLIVCRCMVHPTCDALPFMFPRCLGSKVLWDFSGLTFMIIPVIPWWAKSEKSFAPVPPAGFCHESAIPISTVDGRWWHRALGLWQWSDLSLPEQGNWVFVQLPLLSVSLWFFLFVFRSQWPRCADAPLHPPGGLWAFWAHLWRLHQLFASYRKGFLVPRPLQRRRNSSVKNHLKEKITKSRENEAVKWWKGNCLQIFSVFFLIPFTVPSPLSFLAFLSEDKHRIYFVWAVWRISIHLEWQNRYKTIVVFFSLE